MKAVAKKTSEVVEYKVVDGKYVVTEMEGERTLSESTFKRQFKIVEEEVAVEGTKEDLVVVDEVVGNGDIVDCNETVESVADKEEEENNPGNQLEPMVDEYYEDFIRRTTDAATAIDLEGDMKDYMRRRDSARVAFLENKKSYYSCAAYLQENWDSASKDVQDECNVVRGKLLQYADRSRKYLSRYDQYSATIDSLRTVAAALQKDEKDGEEI